jgi:hypothetical protein
VWGGSDHPDGGCGLEKVTAFHEVMLLEGGKSGFSW